MLGLFIGSHRERQDDDFLVLEIRQLLQDSRQVVMFKLKHRHGMGNRPSKNSDDELFFVLTFERIVVFGVEPPIVGVVNDRGVRKAKIQSRLLGISKVWVNLK